MNAARKILDELMGEGRNEERPELAVRDLRDPQICRDYLLGCCPTEVLETGEPCAKKHDRRLRAEFRVALKTTDFGYERDHMRTLERYVMDADRKINNRKRERVQEEGGGAPDSFAPYVSEDSTPALKAMSDRINELEARIDDALVAGQLPEADALKTELDDVLKARAEEHAKTLMEAATGGPSTSSASSTAAGAGAAPAAAAAAAAEAAPAAAAVTTSSTSTEAVVDGGAAAAAGAAAGTAAAAPAAPAPAAAATATPLPPLPVPLPPVEPSGGSRQRLRVCAVCGSLWSLNDASTRVAEHLSGRHHLGLVAIRRRVAAVREYLRIVALMRTVPGSVTAGFDPTFDYVKAGEALTPEMIAAAKAAPYVERSGERGGDSYAAIGPAGAGSSGRGRSRSRDRGGRDSYYARDRGSGYGGGSYGGGSYGGGGGGSYRDRDSGGGGGYDRYDRYDRDRYDRDRYDRDRYDRDRYDRDRYDRDRGSSGYYDDRRR